MAPPVAVAKHHRPGEALHCLGAGPGGRDPDTLVLRQVVKDCNLHLNRNYLKTGS